MKWVCAVLVLAAGVATWTVFTTADQDTLTLTTFLPDPVMPAEAPNESPEEPRDGPSTPDLSRVFEETSEAATGKEIIHIGEPYDPNDPWARPETDDFEVIHIGEPYDPNDPWARPKTDDSKIIHVGKPFHPTDPFARSDRDR